MARAKDAVGAYGEHVAADYLRRQGMTLLDRNWRGLTGEIDIIARDGDVLVFVEVKTRRSSRFGTPVEAVVPAKAQRLRRLAAQWLAISGLGTRELRFDIIGVLPQRSGPAKVEHLRGAF